MNHRDGRAAQGDVLRSEASHSYSDRSTEKFNISLEENKEKLKRTLQILQ